MAEGDGEGQATGAHTGRPDVFISYASPDTAVANALVAALERYGLNCWIAPRDVTPGELYADEIIRSINGAKSVVVVLSESAVASPHVGKEVERASSKRRPIITFRTDAAPLTTALEYFLSESQWIEVRPGGIEAASEKLVAAVRRRIEAAVSTESRAETMIAGNSGPIGQAGRYALDTKSMTQHRKHKAMKACFAAIVTIVLGYVGVDKFWPSKRATIDWKSTGTAAVVADKSIAVLPFADMSEKKDQEYFADGMAEEILDLLAKLPGIRVIGRTSSFQFKGKTEDLRKIGSSLGAAYVIEGSVRRSGDRLRVTAQLIGAQDGSHVWSETYDAPSDDVLKVQDRIASGLVRALQVTVGADDLGAPPSLRSSEAYDFYLQGRHAVDQ